MPKRSDPIDPVENQPAPPPTLPPKPLTVSLTGGKFASPLAARSPLTVAFRHIRPTWRNYMQFVDYAARNGNLDMARFRDCYLSLTPRDKRNYLPEQLCELANVTGGELIGAVCRAIWESKAAESSMVSSIAHPEVLIETARLAKRPEHYRDRELFFRLTGSLPDKKGASINIFNTPTAQAGDVNLPQIGAPASPRLKSFDEDIIELTRDLDNAPGAPFLVKEEEDVPS